jgi:hypothetical protein
MGLPGLICAEAVVAAAAATPANRKSRFLMSKPFPF